jgi:hypothetical protein
MLGSITNARVIVPFRITINGLSIECDTPEELLTLTKKHAGDESAEDKKVKSIKPVTVSRPKYQPVHRRGFVGSGKLMLEALKEVYPSSITSPRLIARMGIKGLALPAIIMGLRSRARHEGLNFDDIVKSKMGLEKGVTVTIYQITDKGIDALQKYGID